MFLFVIGVYSTAGLVYASAKIYHTYRRRKLDWIDIVKYPLNVLLWPLALREDFLKGLKI